MANQNQQRAVPSRAKVEDRSDIEKYVDSMKLDEPVPVEEFRKVVRDLTAGRGRLLYFVWKVLQEKGLDADELVKEACYRWGQNNGERMGENIKTPSDLLKRLSFKAGVLAWDQQFTILNDETASKEFNYCPHIKAFEELGATKEEIAKLCKEMLCYGDYGMASVHPVKLEWDGKTIAEGAERCVMMLKPRK